MFDYPQKQNLILHPRVFQTLGWWIKQLILEILKISKIFSMEGFCAFCLANNAGWNSLILLGALPATSGNCQGGTAECRRAVGTGKVFGERGAAFFHNVAGFKD